VTEAPGTGSIATEISGDTKWSFVTLDSILKYCSPESARQFMDSLVVVSGEVMEARAAYRCFAPRHSAKGAAERLVRW
jgi:hypothetical protein